MEIKITWHVLQCALTACGGWIGWHVGGVDGFFYTLLVFTIIDYDTRVLAATPPSTRNTKIQSDLYSYVNQNYEFCYPVAV